MAPLDMPPPFEDLEGEVSLKQRTCGSNWSIQSGPPSTLSLPYRPTPVLAFKMKPRTSLGVQWLRSHLPMQGTPVRPLVRVGSTCHGATKPMCCNYWAHAQSPCFATRAAIAMRSPCTPQLETSPPLAATRGSLSAARKTQNSQK